MIIRYIHNFFFHISDALKLQYSPIAHLSLTIEN